MALVTVMTFNRVHEAELARLALEAEGIRAVVLDRFTNGILAENATGGARLQVEDDDVDAADEVLNRLTGVAGAELATPSDEGPWQPPESCPSCGAAEIVRRQKWVAFSIFAAFMAAISYTQNTTLLGFYVVAAAAIFTLVAASWRCRECGYTW